jgi:segregation and condensation protein B
MPDYSKQLEAILFVTARPQSVKRLAEILEIDVDATRQGLEELKERLDQSESALQIVMQGNEAELVTRGECADVVRKALKEEMQAELSRPSLEALAVLAYRGPLTRPELEQIRGVQSSMILRNLSLRGLIDVHEDGRLGQPTYEVNIQFLKHLGLSRLEDLPDFSTMHATSAVEEVLKELEPREESSASSSNPVS